MRRKAVIGLFIIGLCMSALASCPRDILYAQKKPEIGVEYHPEGTQGGPMLYVPLGHVMIGCNNAVDSRCWENELPYHDVGLDAFFIDKFEVTVEQFRECVEAGVCARPKGSDARKNCNWGRPDRDDHPVNCVDWYQAAEYCKWAGKRLPSEAEWEKAARGETGGRYPWGNQRATCEFAIMGDGCGEKHTWPVGSKPGGASPYGAMDMAGNVWEWTADWYDENYYKISPGVNPKGPQTGKQKVLRGGAYDDNLLGLRSTTRSYDEPDDIGSDDGFRCAKSP